MTGDSPTRDLEIHVTARHLTDPEHVRQLVSLLHDINDRSAYPFRGPAAFLVDLAASLTQYADELGAAHDQVIAEVMPVWSKQLDDGEQP